MADIKLSTTHRNLRVTRTTCVALLGASIIGILGFVPLWQSARSAEPAIVPPAVLIIDQFDVDQGDAALVVTPEGKRILIDAGPSPGQVVNLLHARGVDTLDLVIASHNHLDHIGGMPDVLSSLVVRAYMDNALPQTTSTYQRVLTGLQEHPGIVYLHANARTITLGSVTLKVFPPPELDLSQNNNSVGILIQFGQFRALYTGDSEREELQWWLQQRIVPSVSVLKAAHHGSSNGITEEWIHATQPRLVVISAGRENKYGHPSASTIDSWTAAKAQVLRTDVNGTIEIRARSTGEFSAYFERSH